MQLRYRYRLHPTEQQRRALAQAFGNARVVCNEAVRARRDAYWQGEAFPTGPVSSKRLITDAKRIDERGWLGECSNIVLRQAIRLASNGFPSGATARSDRPAPERRESRLVVGPAQRAEFGHDR
ncbi:transposase [Saccharopolyspora lacisalsi]|uniref:Transposase n=1 Tax=Halosaccharopolyspora lacisalsi TaxID=1000566 RepID=A0A839DMW9_9PSEU|nr:helix-turn-helix domain-containing protein [Halosaccharopolyspora lacisalsi]MBA8823302.1 transposase [Halosaccharopolyspora lacisalsi]